MPINEKSAACKTFSLRFCVSNFNLVSYAPMDLNTIFESHRCKTSVVYPSVPHTSIKIYHDYKR